MFVINTKKDVLWAKENLSNWKELARALLDNRFCWKVTGPKVGDGIVDETHQVSENDQLELVEDENAMLFRLGFTVAEIEVMLNE